MYKDIIKQRLKQRLINKDHSKNITIIVLKYFFLVHKKVKIVLNNVKKFVRSKAKFVTRFINERSN